MEKIKKLTDYTINELSQAIKDAKKFISNRTEEVNNDNERSRDNKGSGDQIKKMERRLSELETELQKRKKPVFGKKNPKK